MELNGPRWRKSSRSGDNGGQCVELAVWRKSSRSADNGGQCVELAVCRKSSRSANKGVDEHRREKSR